MADNETQAPQTDPQAPPTWTEIKSDPGFQKLAPAKQLIAFDRWKTDAHTYASRQPDWGDHQETFTKRTEDLGSQLSKAAGGLSPDQARSQVASKALLDAQRQKAMEGISFTHVGQTPTVDATLQPTQPPGLDLAPSSLVSDLRVADKTSPFNTNLNRTGLLTHEEFRNVLGKLGPDVAKGFYADANQADDPSFTNMFLHEFAQGGLSAVKSLVDILPRPQTSSEKLRELDGRIASYESKLGDRPATTAAQDPYINAQQSVLKSLKQQRDNIAAGRDSEFHPNNDARTVAQQDTLDLLQETFSNMGRHISDVYGVNPEDYQNSLTGQAAHSTAQVANLALGNRLFLIKMLGQTFNDAYDHSIAQQKASGETNADKIHTTAQKDAAMMTGELAPSLLFYSAGGSMAGQFADSLLSKTASPLLKTTVGAGSQALANIGVSSAIRMKEGESPFDLGQNLTDIFFGAHGGLHAGFHQFRGERAFNAALRNASDGQLAIMRAVVDNDPERMSERSRGILEQEINRRGGHEDLTKRIIGPTSEVPPPPSPGTEQPPPEGADSDEVIRMRSTNGVHRLDIDSKATPEQLQNFAQWLDTDTTLPTNVRAEFQSQLKTEMDARGIQPEEKPAEKPAEQPAEPKTEEGTRIVGPALVKVGPDGKAILENGKPVELARGDFTSPGYENHAKLFGTVGKGSANEAEMLASFKSNEDPNQQHGHWFIDDKGNLLNRQQAGELADKSGQRDQKLAGSPLQSGHIPLTIPEEPRGPSLPTGEAGVSKDRLEELMAKDRAGKLTPEEDKELNDMLLGEQPAPKAGEPRTEEITTGHTDIPLDERGKETAKKVGEAVGESATEVHSSPLERTKETAAAITEAGGPHVQEDKGLMPIKLGDLEGKPAELADRALAQMIRNPTLKYAKGAESLQTFLGRTIGSVRKLMEQLKNDPEGKIVAVTHSKNIEAILGWFLKGRPDDNSIDPKFLLEHGIQPGEAVRIRLKGDNYTIEKGRPSDKRSGIYLIRHGETAWDNMGETQLEAQPKEKPDLEAEVTKTGLLPTRGQIMRGSEKGAYKETKAKLQEKLATQFPPEALPEGSTEIEGEKHPETGDVLPMVREPKLENGKPVLDEKGNPITVDRAKFTNDPSITAQQMDQGQRVYIPDNIMDEADTRLNPAISPTWDATAKKFYVEKVNTKYGEVSKPDDFTAAYNKASAFSKAQAHVYVDPETLQLLQDNGYSPGLIDSTPTDPPEGAQAVIPTTEAGRNPTNVLANLSELERLGADTSGDTNILPEGSYRTIIASLAKDPKLNEGQRLLAKLIGDVKTLGIKDPKIKLIKDGESGATAWYSVVDLDQPGATAGIDAPVMTINLAMPHEGGISSIFLHESIHHATILKMSPDYQRSPFEQRAYANLLALYDHAVRESFKRMLGREPQNEDELTQFKQAQGGKRDEQIQAALPEEIRGAGHRNLYGLRNPLEFMAELQNPKFLKWIEGLPDADHVQMLSESKTGWRGLWAKIRQSLVELFAGQPASKDSFIGKAINSFNAFTSGGTDISKFAKPVIDLAKYPGPESFKTPSQIRSELEEEAKSRGMEDETINTMTVPELRQALYGNPMPEPEMRPTSDSGWLGPTGKFTSLEGGAIMGIGGHEKMAINSIIKSNPDLQEKWDKLVQQSGGEPSWNLINDFMEQNKFVRVVGGGGPGSVVYVTGDPTPTQKRALIASAQEDGVTLIHDLGTKGKTLYSPDDVLAIPNSGSPDVQLVTTYNKNGKSTTNLDIAPGASRGDMVNMQEQILQDQTINAADKARLHQELAERLGVTATVPVLKGKMIVGYDSANNIANTRAVQQGNRVALLFGGKKSPSEAELNDRAAMPMVIEAGGDKNDLIIGLNRVDNSTDPKGKEYAKVYQYAIDNFERLNGMADKVKAVTKEQLDRERDLGRVTVGELENYVTRYLSTPEEVGKTFMGKLKEALFYDTAGGLGSRSFVRGRRFEKLYDAIAEGYLPKSEGAASPTDIVALTQRRIDMGERLVQFKLLENELRTLRLPDDRPIIGDTEQYESYLGKKEGRVPAGYQIVQTGSKPLVVANEVAPLMQALYGNSNLSTWLKTAAGTVKVNTLIADTYHIGRIMAKELAYSKGAQRLGYGKGLSILDYRDSDLDAALKAGELTQKEVDYAREKVWGDMSRRDVAELLLQNGANVGRITDNLIAEHAKTIPFIRNFNTWIFQKLSRGAMMQTMVENFVRNMNRFPERGLKGLPEDATPAEREKAVFTANARQTALEYNEVFGNLQSQSLQTKVFNKSYQDLVRSLVLAPNWVESQLRAELRGYGQLAKAPVDLLRGNTRVGTVAQGQLTVVLGMLAANQLINYAFKGQSTFQNDKDHKLDAWIPGGKNGFWFNPFEIGGEYAFMYHNYMANQHMNFADATNQILSNKLFFAGRAAHEFLSGRDYRGQKFPDMAARIKASLMDMIPSPLPVSSAFERDPRASLGSATSDFAKSPSISSAINIPAAPLGMRVTRQPGATEKQLLQMGGLKVHAALSPRGEMFALAHPFRSDQSYGDSSPSQYQELRRALDNDNLDAARSEIRLLTKNGATLKELRGAVGLQENGNLKPENFVGSGSHPAEREKAFLKSLTPDQKLTYKQAQADHKKNARAMVDLLRELKPELEQQLRQNAKAPKYGNQ